MEKEQNKRDSAKCQNCGHVVMEHYHLKNAGYGCIGDDEKCICTSFVL
jgi:hypothetical protein